jgi:hypothetical protein
MTAWPSVRRAVREKEDGLRAAGGRDGLAVLEHLEGLVEGGGEVCRRPRACERNAPQSLNNPTHNPP